MRRSLALATAVLAVAPASAMGQTGGVEYRPMPLLAAQSFGVSPAVLAPGATMTVKFRIDGRLRWTRVRIDLVPEGGGPVAARKRLGRRATGREVTARWRPSVAPGRYTARLHATALRRRGGRASGALAIEVATPPAAPPAIAPVAATSGLFPVQGIWSFGAADARFGARRSGHIHQGQDIIAAAGTPVVSPRAGFVSWRAFQAAGAGHYVVVHGDDARDYVFMHLQDGSVAVQKGQAVAAGGLVGAVGSTGRSDGPHLHFEIWPHGWYAEGSQPIDPMPDLLAWSGA